MQPRDQMINTAVALFQSGGYQATSWRKLVEKAGTPWGSAHHYFPGGKTQLGVAAIERAAEAVALLIDHAFPEGATPAQGVRNLFTGSAAMLEKSAFRAGCPIATVALETVPDTPQMAEACAAALERYHAALAAGARGLTGTKGHAPRAHFLGPLRRPPHPGAPPPLDGAADHQRQAPCRPP